MFILSFFLPVAIGFVVQNKLVNNPCTPTRRNNLHKSKTPLFLDKNENNKPSIAIVGSGAVGCYYGARLWETNEYNVIFQMRGEHYEASKEKGLNVTSVDGDMFIPPDELMAYDNVEDIGKVDWVIVALKSTGVEAAKNLVLPLLHKNTRVVCIMNGMVDDDIVRLLEGVKDKDIEPELTKCAGVFAGMALLCSNRIAPGHVDHSYAGKLTISLAKSSSNDSDDIKLHQELTEALWAPTQGFEFVYDPNYVRARWSKNVWNLPFNGISVAMNGITVDKIVNDPGLRSLAYTIMDETIAIANKELEVRGYTKDDFLGEAEKKAMMDLSDAMGPYRTSTMLDLTNRKPMEVKYLFREAVDRANKLSVPAPTLETIVTFIEALQRFYKL